MPGKKAALLGLVLAGCAAGCAAHRPAAPPPTEAPRPERHARRGRYWLFVENITTATESGGMRAVRLWVALPLERPGQRVRLGQIVPPPTEILEDAATGNRVIYWEVKDPPEGGTLVLHYDFEVENSMLSHDLDPARVRRVPPEDPRFRRFTRSQPWVEVTPEIAGKAREIVGQEDNPLRQARLVFDWIVDNVTYDYPDVKSRGVKLAFQRLKGDCGEFSHIFIAMMRALGVPARSVVAVWYQGSGHAWAEILLPPYGWVPVDTSVAQLVKNGLKGQMSAAQVKSFMDSRGIPTRDPRWLLGHLYPHRLEVYVGDHHELRAGSAGGTRAFHFLQPGGRAGWPAPYELLGLSKSTVLAGFYRFGAGARDEKLARQQAHEKLAPVYLTAGLHEKALPGLRQLVKRRPNDATALFQLGQVHFHLGHYREAIPLLQRSLDGKGGSTKPTTDVWALILGGMCHDALGLREQALARYRQALTRGVDFASAQKTAKTFIEKPFKPEAGK